MSLTNQRLTAALIAAHPERKIFGRTRLQKEIKLLQRLGFPTDYSYTIHFYGPYSESLYADIGVMEAFGLIRETQSRTMEGNDCYILEAADRDDLPDVSGFQPQISRLDNAGSVVLELAATYDSFREQGDGHDRAWSASAAKRALSATVATKRPR